MGLPLVIFLVGRNSRYCIRSPGRRYSFMVPFQPMDTCSSHTSHPLCVSFGHRRSPRPSINTLHAAVRLCPSSYRPTSLKNVGSHAVISMVSSATWNLLPIIRNTVHARVSGARYFALPHEQSSAGSGVYVRSMRIHIIPET